MKLSQLRMKTSLLVFGILLTSFFVCFGLLTSIVYSHLCTISMPVIFDSIIGSMSIGAFVYRFICTSFTVVTLIAFAAGSSAGNLAKEFPFAFRAAAFCRTPMLMFIVVPISYIMRLYADFQIQFDHIFPASDGTHEERVEQIAEQIVEWNKNGRNKKIRTSRPNWAAMSTKLASNKEDANKIALGHMNHILNVDYTNKTIKCEPGVTMGQITHLLVPQGFALQIQIEMESITIGGVTMGFGMETNSHTIGFFQESVIEYEIVTSDGTVRTVNANNDPELFYALPWSAGTLGLLTAVTVKIHEVKPYVHVKYIPTHSPKELCDLMTKYSESPKAPTFLEATVYTKDTSVVQMGNFVDAPKTPQEKAILNDINSFWKPFYYKHVETFIEKGGGEEIIPLMDYYHRFTRSIFWEIEDMIPFSNHWLYRCLWGWMGPPEVSLLKLFQGPVIRKASVYAHVVQESIMPVRCLDEGVDLFDDWFGVYPLLVFPLRVYDRGENSGFLKPQARNLKAGKNWGIWVDLGAYGAPRLIKEGKTWDAKSNIREMEHWTRDKGGWQAYYTDLFCTYKEFRQMFCHDLWDKQREELGCDDAFPTIYDKVKPESGIVDLDREVAEELVEDMQANLTPRSRATRARQRGRSNATDSNTTPTKSTSKSTSKSSSTGAAGRSRSKSAPRNARSKSRTRK